jgi:hypothetical protein
MPQRAVRNYEASTIGDKLQSTQLRHSGEGRNPAGLFNMLSAFVSRCGSLFSDWIPAYAGMTVVTQIFV